MATTINDSMPGISTESSAGKQNSRRTDAVGVEIPVMVHASRNSVTSREISRPLPPVHEETRTVIVFPQGAVVRLTAAMTAGELVVLTNQRSGADVLCRVASVKAQPGIQNYVDLEFTQRAPGFWGDCFPSEAAPAIPAMEFALPQSSDSVAPSLNKPVPPQLAPVTVAPAAPAVLPPVSVAPAAPVVPAPVHAAPVAVPPVTFSTLPAMRPEAEPPAVAPVAPASSGSGLSLGLMRPAEQPQPWARSFESIAPADDSASGSRKMILMAVAAVVLLSVIGGGVVMLRKGSAAPAASQAAAPAQTPAQSSTQSLPVASAAIPPASSVVPQPEAAAAPVTPLRPSEPVVSQSSEVAPKSAALPKQPPRNAVALAVGKLSAPVVKKAAAASSTEAPPVLPASAAASPVGTSLLLNSDQNSGPVSPATLARNTTLIGGRVLDPKLISSASPTYPPQATLQRVQGDVVVDALVDAKGRVSEAKAVSGSPLLQQAAVNAVRTWKYEPARLDGEAVAAHLQVKISFRLP